MNKKLVSELRQDLVSGDWVVVASRRGKRPHPIKQKVRNENQPKKNCPFENPQKNGNDSPLLIFYKNDFLPKVKDWTIQVIPNKYPAFGYGVCNIEHKEGPYNWLEGYGFHEVFIYRDHIKNPALFNSKEITQMFSAFIKRYLALKNEGCVEYISIFHNHKREAGASISHPHSQLIAIPVIPPDVQKSINGSRDFFQRNKKCVHCAIMDWEIKSGKRLVYENKNFVAFCPYASRTSFETRIFPKNHESCFEKQSESDLNDLSEIFNATMKKIYGALNNPPYNFFIHTAPVSNGHYSHYHWHIEILPKTSIWAGFEIGTGIEISTISPEEAAEELRNKE